MRRIFTIFTIFGILCLFTWAPVSHSQDGAAIFQTKCGKCHGSGGDAPAFSPVKYASSQWERFFERNKHARKKDISGEISASDLASVKRYLVSHAADSDLPIAAGLR